MSTADSEHAVTRDRRDFYDNEVTSREYLRHAVKKSGRRPLALTREYLRLLHGRLHYERVNT